MNSNVKQLAIIGPTASGKSDLAIKVAQKINAYVLSIDSLSVYKEIDVVSAKPSKEELRAVKHFGVNVLSPDEYFSVDLFIDLYKQVIKKCREESKNLVIVGGTSFYLKSLVQGLSPIPKATKEVLTTVKKKLKDLKSCHRFLSNVDPEYMKNVSDADSYRIEKALIIYEASKQTPSQWFKNNPPEPVIKNLDIYNIEVDRDVLRKRISKRVDKMLCLGLFNEVCALERKYSRSPNSMGAIGIVEVLEYLDSKVTKEEALQNISIHTAQLAKRQATFNRTQFEKIVSAPLEELQDLILEQVESND